MTTAIQTDTAVGYFRVSSPGQAGERHVSLEVQESKHTDYCRAEKFASNATFTDVVTGRKDNRAQYRAMLVYIVEHGIGNVVVLLLDRFGRNPREILRRYWELEERGVTVQSIMEPDIKEELMLLLRAGIAGQESKRTSERVRMSLRKAAEKGKLVSKLPFGYTKIFDSQGNPLRVEQVPQEAAVIRLAYELATVRNLGYKAIADELNRLGNRTKSGALFAAQSVKLILLNPAMAGNPVFQGHSGDPIINEGAYPAILTAEEWEQLQQRLTIRREGQHRGRTDSSPYLLSGILRCGHCGGAMAGASSGPGRHAYYVCCNRKMARALCDQQVSHRREPLEEAILEHLGQYSDPDMVRELLEAQGQKTDHRAEQELAAATKRLGELEQAFLNDLDRVDRHIMTEEQYLLRQRERDTEQAGLKARRAELEAVVSAQRDVEAAVATVPDKIGSFLEDVRDMDVREAKAIFQAIIRSAHVFSDGRIEMQFR